MTVVQSVEIREVDEMSDLRAVEALFVSVWRTSADQPPVNAEVLRALSHAGCYVAAAFEDDQLLGASVGFLGGTNGTVQLHSHITGVATTAQGRHVGRLLKLHQRDWCLGRGIDTVTWTFDPLIRRNAWFNLQRLGADIVGFERDFYGSMRDGINTGDRSDRCLVHWHLPRAAGRAPVGTGSPAILASAADGRPVTSPIETDSCRVALPPEFERLRREQPTMAGEWREAFRATFGSAIEAGYGVVGMTEAREYALARTS